MSGFSTSTTYADLVDEIIMGLQGYALTPDAMSVLTADISATDTTIPVDDTSVFGRGIVEIGRELVYVSSIDERSGTLLTNAAWRGHRGSLAEAHTRGTTVTFRPAFPRAQVAREANNILRGLYPSVYAVKSVELVGQGTSPHYELPSEVDHVLDVRAWRDSLEGWVPVKAWDVDFQSPSTFTSRVVLNLFGLSDPGVKLQVLYAAEPVPLSEETDVFTTVTGLPESCKELVIAGAQHRLTQHIDPARLLGASAEADAMNRPYQPGLAQQVASSFGKQYQEALLRERTALNAKYPARIHKVR